MIRDRWLVALIALWLAVAVSWTFFLLETTPAESIAPPRDMTPLVSVPTFAPTPTPLAFLGTGTPVHSTLPPCRGELCADRWYRTPRFVSGIESMSSEQYP